MRTKLAGSRTASSARDGLLFQIASCPAVQRDVIVLRLDVVELSSGMMCTRVPSFTTMRSAVPAGGRAPPIRPAGRSPSRAAGPLQGPLETLRAERLQQVIHRVGVESAHRVLVVSSDENDGRTGIDQFEHFEAIQLGHLDIEEEKVGRGLRDCFHCFEAIGDIPRRLRSRDGRQQFTQEPAGQLFIVHDHRAKRTVFHGHSDCSVARIKTISSRLRAVRE